MSTEHVYIDRLTLALLATHHPTVGVYVANDRLGDYETYHAGCLNLSGENEMAGKQVSTYPDDVFRLTRSSSCANAGCTQRSKDVLIFDTLEEIQSCSP